MIIGVTATYTWLNALLLNEHFERRRAAVQESYAHQLQALLDRSSKRLEHLGTVFASSSDVQGLVQSPTDELAAANFERLWTSLTIDMGVETVGLFSHQGSPIATRGWDRVAGSAAVSVLLPAVSRDERPRALYDCRASACSSPPYRCSERAAKQGRWCSVSRRPTRCSISSGFGYRHGSRRHWSRHGRGRLPAGPLYPVLAGNGGSPEQRPPRHPPAGAVAARYRDPAELATPRYEHVGDQVFELRMAPLAGTETNRSYVVVIAESPRPSAGSARPRTRTSPSACSAWSSPNGCSLRCSGVLSCASGARPATCSSWRTRRSPTVRSAIGFRPHWHFWRHDGGCLERDRSSARRVTRGPARGVADARRRAGYRTRLRHQCPRDWAGHHPDQDTPGRHQDREPPCPGAVGVLGREAGSESAPPSSSSATTRLTSPLDTSSSWSPASASTSRRSAISRSRDGENLNVVWHHSILKGTGRLADRAPVPTAGSWC